mmetsp:Transcript_4651/g.11736  ORF Transcript_4651/g.11736 Transcript_4651/m.11736 type:complete len:368 (-) Transcript_4651:521-1624(-)
MGSGDGQTLIMLRNVLVGAALFLLLLLAYVERSGRKMHFRRACPPGQAVHWGFFCSVCPEATMKPTAGMGRCIPCPEGSWAGRGQAWCECKEGLTPANLKWDMDGADSVFACVPCAVGTWKGEMGNVACRRCASGSTSPKGSVNASQCVQWVSTILHCVSGDCHNVNVLVESASDTTAHIFLRTSQMAGAVLHETVDTLEGVTVSAVEMALDAASIVNDAFDAASDLVTDLFKSKSEFASEVHKAADGARKDRRSSGSCETIQCSTPQAFGQWYRTSALWGEFDAGAKGVERKATSKACKRMRDAAKDVLMHFHPDKVALSYSQCPHGATLPAIQELNRRYTVLKSKCFNVRNVLFRNGKDTSASAA